MWWSVFIWVGLSECRLRRMQRAYFLVTEIKARERNSALSHYLLVSLNACFFTSLLLPPSCHLLTLVGYNPDPLTIHGLRWKQISPLSLWHISSRFVFMYQPGDLTYTTAHIFLNPSSPPIPQEFTLLRSFLSAHKSVENPLHIDLNCSSLSYAGLPCGWFDAPC